MKAPFTYFGGKSQVAEAVWERFGNTRNYIEPFFGSGAVLLLRPDEHLTDPRIETVNDIDSMICNFWRSVQKDPQGVAKYADWPVIEQDLHSRHAWLSSKKDSLQAKLEGDPDYCDIKIAGWWVWGMALWIAGGFCTKNGPWVVEDGLLVKKSDDRKGITKQLPHLHGSKGIARQIPHLRNPGMGVERPMVVDGNSEEGDAGDGSKGIYAWMDALSERLRRVRVVCGDWSRILGPTPTFKLGTTAVFMDPPYSDPDRCEDVYGTNDDMGVARAVRDWCVASGTNPELRIALCGYEGEHEMPDDWEEYKWEAQGGYGNQKKDKSNVNRFRERIWFSPHCLKPSTTTQKSLFD